MFKIHSRITNPIASLFANVKASANKTQNKHSGNVVDYVGYFSTTDDYKPYYNPEVVQSFAHTLSPPGYVGSSSIPIAPPKRGTYQYGKRFLLFDTDTTVTFQDVWFRLKFYMCVEYLKMKNEIECWWQIRVGVTSLSRWLITERSWQIKPSNPPTSRLIFRPDAPIPWSVIGMFRYLF